MTNPNNAIGTNGAYGGRTSVNAFNDNLAVYTSRGTVSGWACVPSSGMAVELGGVSGTRDVAVAEDNGGNRTTVNNISGQPVEVTLSAAPSTNSRIDAIVAYVENPPQGTSSDLDNPAACGIIAVTGTAAASPSVPSEATIRSAITVDGGAGSTAYYVVLATVTVASGTTDIDSNVISAGASAGIGSPNIDWATLTRVSTNNGLPFGVSVRYLRVGNVVIMQTPEQTNSTFPQSGEGAASETVPAGYRPAYKLSVPIASMAVRLGNGGVIIDTDGSISYFASFNSTDVFRPSANAVWVTNDAWPED